MNTFGPTYDKATDGERLATQMETILQYVRGMTLGGSWLTLKEIARDTGFPEASISAQLRHLRKPQFGSWRVEKQRRNNRIYSLVFDETSERNYVEVTNGSWEYRILPPVPSGQMKMWRE